MHEDVHERFKTGLYLCSGGFKPAFPIQSGHKPSYRLIRRFETASLVPPGKTANAWKYQSGVRALA
jgi:hypothetical protein